MTAAIEDLIQQLHNGVVGPDGLDIETVLELDSDELEEAYQAAWQVSKDAAEQAAKRLQWLAESLPWQDKASIAATYNTATFWQVILCQLGMAQRVRGEA